MANDEVKMLDDCLSKVQTKKDVKNHPKLSSLKNRSVLLQIEKQIGGTIYGPFQASSEA